MSEVFLAFRASTANPNHHLWNNNGTWWLHCTVHRSDFTKQRIRTSLRTPCLSLARRRRDTLLKTDGGQLLRTGLNAPGADRWAKSERYKREEASRNKRSS